MRGLLRWLVLLMSSLVSPEEIQHWHDGFIKDCPTGKLTKTEFARIYSQFFPHGDPTSFAS